MQTSIERSGKFLVIVLSQDELEELRIISVVPQRTVEMMYAEEGRSVPGCKPGPAYWETDTVTVKGVDTPKWTWAGKKEPSVHQQRRMMARLISECVKLQMENHVYRFEGRVFKQSDGGPIGDELSQAVARVVMGWWDSQFLKKCEEVGIDIMMYKRYVDDTNKVFVPPALGSEFRDGQIVVNELKAVEDANRPRDQVAAELLTSIANSISSMIKMEADTCSKYPDKKLPILDLKVWIDNEADNVEIKHQFYKKPMAKKRTILAKSALPVSNKRAILVEEAMRRMRNCSPQMSWSEKGKFLSQFAAEMRNSGHAEHFRVTVMSKAVEKHRAELERHEAGTDLYRSRKVRQEQAKQSGGKSSREDWFKKKGGSKVTSVLKVPLTANQELSKGIKSIVKDSKAPEGIVTRVQEANGEKLKFLLTKSDPFPRSECGRQRCPLSHGDEGCREQCYQSNCNYTIFCKRCDFKLMLADEAGGDQPEPCRHVYVGESCRGCYTRFQQHLANLKAKKGFMWDHLTQMHKVEPSEDPRDDFGMKRVSVDKDPLRRIVREAIRQRRILDKETGTVWVTASEEGAHCTQIKTILLNSKEEFHLPRMISLTDQRTE